MLKVLINEEEVVANQNFTINKHMLNTPSVILNNVCPKSWCDNKNYTGFYHPLDYSKCKIMDIPTEEEKIGQYQKITTLGTITNVDLTKGNEITQLDGLTTQDGTPTPDNPVAVNVVSGRQEIKVCGKNVYNKDVFIQGTWQSSSSSNRIVGFLTPTKAGQKYRVTLRNNELDFAIGNTTKNVQSGNTTVQSDSGWKTTDYTYNITGDGYLFLQVKKRYGGNLTPSDLSTTDFQVELGETGTTFEEYKGQSYEINLGKNLLDTSTITSGTTNGIDYENNNGTITLDGTATSNSYIATWSSRPYILEAGTYTISANNETAVEGTNNYIRLVSLSGTAISGTSANFTVANNHTTFTLTEETTARFQIRTNEGTTYDNFVIRPMLEKGSQASSYTSYKTPIELCKIGDYQDFIKKGTGKNLFSLTNIENNGTGRTTYEIQDDNIIITTLSSGTYRNIYKTIDNLTIGQPYTIKINNHNDTSTNKIAQWGVANTNGTYYDGIKTLSSTQTITFTPTETSILFRAGYLSNSCNEDDTLTIGKIQLEKSTTTPYEPYGMYNKWYIEKNIGKVVLNGSENWGLNQTQTNTLRFGNTTILQNGLVTSNNKIICNMFTTSETTDNGDYEHIRSAIRDYPTYLFVLINKDRLATQDVAGFKSWLSTHNTTVYYILNTPTYTEITDSEFISQLNAITLINGLNNIAISSVYLSAPITFRYNYWLDKLLFCGVVKNSGKISLNPREPHYTTLQILDFKDFLSTGETLDYVIYQKTILEAIQQVISSISDYGFILGNVNILNPDDIIGAYSTKDKTAYDVFNYIADITQSRWTTRMINENQVAIDFYDPTLMPEGTEIDYTDTFFKTNLIDDMTYKYGTNNYRNKQVMISNQVIGNLAQIQTFTSNGYQNQYIVDLPVAEIQKVYVNGEEKTFASYQEYELGINADFYYTVNSNIIESENILDTSSRIEIYYIPIIEGRQVIVDEDEISRINTSTGRKGIVSRYEQRNDATTSLELQKIGESYIKYKGTPEIVLTIKSRTNIWEVGQRVQFNAPIDELNTTYMVRTKKIEYISSINILFYTYELVSSFNSETEINYFDNQRAKSKGNIGDGEYISRNIDIENTADIIFYDTTAVEMTFVGDNVLDSVLNSPFTN